MAKKDNLPLAVDTDMEAGSSIVYANEVIATIAGVAATEVEGIASMCNISGGSLLGKKNSMTKGVKVEVGAEEVSVDLYLTVEYGTPIQKAAHDTQENVRRAIESITGLHVSRVDVHVQGVSFEKENSALTAGQKSAVLEAAAEPETAECPAQEPVAESDVPETVEEESAQPEEADEVETAPADAADAEETVEQEEVTEEPASEV